MTPRGLVRSPWLAGALCLILLPVLVAVSRDLAAGRRAAATRSSSVTSEPASRPASAASAAAPAPAAPVPGAAAPASPANARDGVTNAEFRQFVEATGYRTTAVHAAVKATRKQRLS